MNYLNWNEINELAVKAENKWAIYINNSLDLSNAVDNKVWDSLVELLQAIFGGCYGEYYDYVGWFIAGGISFFESEKEAQYVFDLLNKDTNHSSFYMVMYSPKDGCVNENR